MSPLVSPIDQPKSPDLIFDMSPISPISPPFNHSIPLSTSNDLNDQTPFVYSVPVYIPRSRANTEIRSRPRVMPSLTVAPISAAHRNIWRGKMTHPEGVNDNYDNNAQSGREDLPRAQSTTKITGFIPIIESQPSMADHYPLKPAGRLSPPPRRSSYSSSPWILPSNDNVEDDIAYSQTDPSLLEFKRHLLRRIENRDSSRFMSFQSCL